MITKKIKHEEIINFLIEHCPLKMRDKIFLTPDLNESMRNEEKNNAIKIDVFSKVVIKSILPAILINLLIVATLSNTPLFAMHIEKFFTASVGIFVAFFAFNYTLFNNQWKYTADLYNKIYIDLSYNTDPVSIFRKRCLLAHDIILQNLQYHTSFEKEFNQTVILAAYFCKEFNLIEDMKLLEDTKNKLVTFTSSPEKVLTQAIIMCENAEFRNFLNQEKNKNTYGSNESLQLINTILEKINNEKLNLEESKKILLQTKTILQNKPCKEAIDEISKAS